MLKIEIPTTCPSCGYLLETVNEQLFCRNTACDAQLGKKLEHFCKVLQIKGFGPKTIEKLKSADLATVLASFSIPLVGGTASGKIAAVVSSIEEINQETCKIAGLGEKVTANLLNWINTEYPEMKEFLPFSFKTKKTVVSADSKRVCITGKLKSFKKKADAESILAAAGFTLVDSVTKTTDYLVDEEGKMSSKREKAVQYGITIITDLNDLLKENKND
jgi:DNA ligase (NAD+)